MDIESIIKSVGDKLIDDFNKLTEYEVKEKYELVSLSDKTVENELIQEISKLYPDDSIFSEEIGSIDKGSNRRWIIDPIDGTADFIFGVPYFAISVALEKDNGIEEGYVFNPVSNEFYKSNKNEGKSYLNNKEIHVSNTESISESLIAFGFSANPRNIKRYLEEWNGLMCNCKKALPLITPALTICNVARGRIDAYIDFGSSMEGKAAASLILENAGGKIEGYMEEEFDYKKKGHICYNGIINLERDR
ncbi:MAG TPA: hypothetical protein DCO79_17075 [Spirochaeta sp.]|nr:hypothetical protein [Spirochaeta sp.]